jgi:type II secretory pathway component PulF
MKFAYCAFDRSGKKVTGTTEAAGTTEATEALRRQGLFVTEISAADGVANVGDSRGAASRGRRVGAGQRLRCVSMFARQLHVLVSSGTALVQGLTAIERQTESARWKAVVTEIRQHVEEGSPLSHAMRGRPEYFDAICVSLMAAGEASGSMTPMLDRLASLLQKRLQLRQALLGAIVYPCVLILLGIGVLLVMLLFVLPRFAVLFASLDSPLPPTTRALLWASEILKSYWWALVLVLAGGIAGARVWLRSSAGRQALNRAALELPKLRRIVRGIMTARLSRMLGVLLESRVPLVESLQLTRQSMANTFYVQLLASAEDAVSRGEAISTVLSTSDLIIPCVQEAIRNGEASGQLGAPLLHMADFLDEENDVVVKAMTRLLEPAILAALGLIVGFIAMSMFLPLFDLVSAVHGGG